MSDDEKKKKEDQFNFFDGMKSGPAVRPEGGTWQERAAGIAKSIIPIGWVGSGEDLRKMLIHTDRIEPPQKDNQWGALTRYLGDDETGILQQTGRWVAPKSAKSHGSKKPEWTRFR